MSQRIRRLPVKWFGAIALLACTLPLRAWGAGPAGSEFQVNTFTSNFQRCPAVAADGAGNFVVVWESITARTGTPSASSASASTATGAALGSEFQVNTYTTNDQQDADVAADGAGNFVVVWESRPARTATTIGVFGQRFDSTGAALGSEFQVNTYTTDDQYLTRRSPPTARATSWWCGRATRTATVIQASSASASTAPARPGQRVPGQHLHRLRARSIPPSPPTARATSWSCGRACSRTAAAAASSASATTAQVRRWAASSRSTPTPPETRSIPPSPSMARATSWWCGTDHTATASTASASTARARRWGASFRPTPTAPIPPNTPRSAPTAPAISWWRGGATTSSVTASSAGASTARARPWEASSGSTPTPPLTRATPPLPWAPQATSSVVWTSDGQDGSDEGIFGQRLCTVMTCTNGDGCCPVTCNPGNDDDCADPRQRRHLRSSSMSSSTDDHVPLPRATTMLPLRPTSSRAASPSSSLRRSRSSSRSRSSGDTFALPAANPDHGRRRAPHLRHCDDGG